MDTSNSTGNSANSDGGVWVKITPAIRKEAKIYFPLGIGIALLHLALYRLLKIDIGNILLAEHLVLYALTFFAILVWIVHAIQRTPTNTNWFYSRVDAIQKWVVGLGCVGFCIISGFAVVAACTGAFFYAFKFFLAAVYFASFAELASNFPLERATLSRVYHFAWAMIVVTPFTY